MCVLAFAWRVHPQWQLVVAGNRDEYHARSAEPLARWNSPHDILAGQDLHSGGTWLGVSERGAFGVVTNFRGFGPPQAARPSRGILLRDLVSGAGQYSLPSDTDFAAFNPFNLVKVEQQNVFFMTNRPVPARRALAPGIHALANGTLDEPWLKTIRLKRALISWFRNGAKQPETLVDALRDESDFKFGSELTSNQNILVNDPLSPIFVRDAVYGTRCSTIVAIDDKGHGTIIERRFNSLGEFAGETDMRFTWPRGIKINDQRSPASTASSSGHH